MDGAQLQRELRRRFRRRRLRLVGFKAEIKVLGQGDAFGGRCLADLPHHLAQGVLEGLRPDRRSINSEALRDLIKHSLRFGGFLLGGLDVGLAGEGLAALQAGQKHFFLLESALLFAESRGLREHEVATEQDHDGRRGEQRAEKGIPFEPVCHSGMGLLSGMTSL